jgi:hypothetical protein
MDIVQKYNSFNKEFGYPIHRTDNLAVTTEFHFALKKICTVLKAAYFHPFYNFIIHLLLITVFCFPFS